MTAKLILKRNKDRPVRARHPWIFSGAIERVEDAREGGTIDLFSHGGEFLARGYYNARSQIAARIWTLLDEPIDGSFFRRRLEQAIAARREMGLYFRQAEAPTDAFRLVNAEADLLPGVIVDAYGPFLVIQILTSGAEHLRDELVAALDALLHPEGIWERSDVEVRAKEGLSAFTGLLFGREPPPLLEIRENGLRFAVDLHRGQKTGFYLDQRQSREHTARILHGLSSRSSRLEVLNVFSYTGAFGVYACHAHPQARVLNIDASSEALDLARENFSRNAVSDRATYEAGDAFSLLRRLRDGGRQFEVILLDPPKFAQSKAQVMNACRGYKDLNLLALKLLRPGGTLLTFSCSGLVSSTLFQQVVFEAAHDAGRYVRLVARLGHAPDHPVLLSFPEGEYLKGLVLQSIEHEVS